MVWLQRRGKHQLLHLDGGSVLHVHFRMAGDWTVITAGAPLPRHARAVLELDDGTGAVLVDPRALSTVRFHPNAGAALPELGPEADDTTLSGAALRQAIASRRTGIKVALLDQRIIAGLGNIYAAEALWSARIDPRTPASQLGLVRCDRLVIAIREVLATARRLPGRAGAEGSSERAVYGRDGERCLRGDGWIRRIRQSGRSTYYCPRCQR
ncbi:MAG: bifunctional DNA-formamidopyrimidine glycosylase/DNA-(apurinic or apyrimidinic site) lyase [Gemmatimonadaceae bacterium]